MLGPGAIELCGMSRTRFRIGPAGPWISLSPVSVRNIEVLCGLFLHKRRTEGDISTIEKAVSYDQHLPYPIGRRQGIIFGIVHAPSAIESAFVLPLRIIVELLLKALRYGDSLEELGVLETLRVLWGLDASRTKS